MSWKFLPCVNASTLWDFSWLATGLQIFPNASHGLLFSPTPNYLQPFAFLQQSHFLPRLAGLTVLTGYDRHIRGRHRLKTSKKKLSGVTPLWRKSFRSSIFPVIVLWHNQDKNTIRDGGGYTLLSLHTFCTFHVNKCSTYMRGHVCPYISIIAYPSWFERMGETTWTGASTCICVIYIPRKLWKFLEHHLFIILKKKNFHCLYKQWKQYNHTIETALHCSNSSMYANILLWG